MQRIERLPTDARTLPLSPALSPEYRGEGVKLVAASDGEGVKLVATSDRSEFHRSTRGLPRI
jgi:hypothetical protein